MLRKVSDANFPSSTQRYELLKAHAEEKLEEANKEIDNISRGQVGELGALGGQ